MLPMLFIPAHLVADVVEGAAKTHVKDDFGFEMIGRGNSSLWSVAQASVFFVFLLHWEK